MLRNKDNPTQEIQGNMPSLLVVYKPRPTQEPKKVTPVDIKQTPVQKIILPTKDVNEDDWGNEPIEKKKEPVQSIEDQIIQLDVDNYEKFLRDMIAPKSGVTLEQFVDAVNSIPDKELRKKVVTKLQVLYDPSAAQELVGVPKQYQASGGKIDKIAIEAFKNPGTFTPPERKKENPIDIPTAPIKKIPTNDERDEPKKIELPSTQDNTEDNAIQQPEKEPQVELTPAFIDLAKVTPEQKIRLQNSVVGIKVLDLVSKVNNIDDK